uniref:Zn(2)-C6 fungal-type domain-containing protein n=1 Tax=Ganoderma boninense TaxID=34458 RepID=A0A5K1JYV6_9APHY|nr:Zn(2)-C6 fungal-type domain-containing protein [Ganoderma boninense]
MPRVTSLNDADETLLKARLAEYRSTASSEKEAFRQACAKYILRARQLDDSNEYMVELFSAKVRNWFQNNTEKKQARLPMRIQQSFHPLRVFGHKNRDLIREALRKENTTEGVDDRAYIVQWNATVRRLWDELPEEEQRPYIQLAELWSLQGPDDDLKPWMAERRGGVWMRSVANMFWEQCGMPIFVYGMFKGTDGKLRAMVYDTTQLWNESNPSTPQFRSVKGWDTDFRRTAWTFFQAILDPEQASQDTLELVHATRRQPPAPVTFEVYADGTPIMPTDPEGGQKKGPTTARRQQILREYIRMHYSHAKGQEARSVPWKSIRDVPDQFFSPGMLPPGFTLQDPSKVVDDDLTKFFKHVHDMENGLNGEATRFRFAFFQTGSKGNFSYTPAVYGGSVEPAEVRRPKKQVQVPTFDGPPSEDESDEPVAQPVPPMLPRVRAVPGPSSVPAALVTDFERIKASLQTVSGTSSTTLPPVLTIAEATAPLTTTAGVTAAQNAAPASTTPIVMQATVSPNHDAAPMQPWVEAEFDGAKAAEEEWADADDELLQRPWAPPPSDDEGHEEDLTFASDDEVEDVLDFAAGHPPLADDSILDILPPTVDSEGTSSTAHVVRQRRRPTRPLASPRPPQSVPRDGEARFGYVRALADDQAYQELLRVTESQLREVAIIRGKSPVLWLTWGLKAPHVPESVQTSEAKTTAFIAWIKKGLGPRASAVEVQRYCLAVGILLSDLDFIHDTIGVTPWPEQLPGYLAYSELDGIDRADILRVCDTIVSSRAATGADVGTRPESSSPAEESQTAGRRTRSARRG